MEDPRILFDPNREIPRPGDGAPRAVGSEATKARYALGEYLDAVLPRPLLFDDAQAQGRIEQALDTMTRAERVYLEIEMTERARRLHSFDYDPLR